MYVVAETLSQAWQETVDAVAAAPGQKMFHTMTTISMPLDESPTVRRACDALLAARECQSAETVANTIFPAALAAASKGPEDLVKRYQAMYDDVRRLSPNNRLGTYFGRLVAYPGQAGEIDQLNPLISKLRAESSLKAPKAARYEIDTATAVEVSGADGLSHVVDQDGDALDETAGVVVHAAGRDRSPMGFPCLSGCSFQLDHGRVHLLAHYRYEYLIARGYGNYLGLARLLDYVATNAGLRVGQLTIVTGRAYVDAPASVVRNFLHTPLFEGN